jgi:hypothetical protein
VVRIGLGRRTSNPLAKSARTLLGVPQVRFTVEQAGCPSCAARIESALALVTQVEAIDIDEERT